MFSLQLPERERSLATRNLTLFMRAVLLTIMCGILVFNFQSTDSKSFSNAITVVSAVLLTSKTLFTDHDISTTGVTTVAIFWIHYGIGIICEAPIDAGKKLSGNPVGACRFSWLDRLS
ncbi:hypothetical protein KIN20_035567 [Parelaphostrongylus tenuis]|uniref:Uncharacterized protein n=1 Tax=Parelaphostrongylus tenuis TaxID=148309 RepID=A0AAD5REN1_PARTN|nr:hypothetical protein KIN20_035567 [Parelaphostrongylus tenuis]